jgi:superfamily II DNA or RNA helicase
MKIHVGIQNSRIETDNPKLLQALYELYSFKIPGAEYSAAYKRRQWDGKTHFITKSGVFKSGLLSRLLVDLKKIDCEPEVEYEHSITSEWYHHQNISIEGFKYYEYQEELISLGLSKMRGIIKSPTGSGKTLIMAGLIKALGRRNRKMVILFNAKQLLTQTYDFLTETCGINNIGLCFGEGYIYGDIMLCTVQSIEKILDTHLEDTEVLMVDECHEFGNGKTTLAALRSFPKAVYRIGFTATPPRESVPRYNLEGALGSVLEVVDTAALVDSGKLTKPLIQLIDRPYDASGLDEDIGYLNVYEDYIVNNEARNNIIKEIVNDIRKQNQTSRILILTKSLDHGRTLENLLGGNCEFLQGCDSIGERYNAISRFRRCGQSSILIGTKILQTGVNIEEITHFINARGMKSEIATLQALGRALRRHDNKEVVYIYDFMDKEKYLKDHSISRKRHYEREGHKVTVC